MPGVAFNAYQFQAARQREQAQAVARPARVRFFVLTENSGEVRLEGAAGLAFGAFMLEEPTFTFGARVLHPLASGALPTYSATVLNYVLHERGFYIGAEMGFTVASTDPAIRLQFSLTFEAHTLRTTATELALT